MNNINLRISELKKQIETLPAGSVVTKTVHGKQKKSGKVYSSG